MSPADPTALSLGSIFRDGGANEGRLSAPIRRSRHLDRPAGCALLLCLWVFCLLWLLNGPYRQVYQPTHDDVTALADGLLLRHDAHWQDWFSRGFSDFFDAYPEWSLHETGFARPAFQVLIYLAHFVLARNWASYLALNYLGIAGVGAIAFAITRTALGLGMGVSLLAASLVLTSSAVLEFSLGVLGASSESFAAILVGAAFLAMVARRDAAAFALLMVALFTKETAAWAPIAAALTALVRAGNEATPQRRMRLAAALLLPLSLWLGFRMIFFGGIGGTYATAGYIPLTEFWSLTLGKLLHLHHLFVAQDTVEAEAGRGVAARALGIGAGLLVAFLLIAWLSRAAQVAWEHLVGAARGSGWPTVETKTLVSLWAVLGLAFYFALALSSPRYAAAVVLFAWPAVVAEVVRRRGVVLRLSLAACLLISLLRTAHLVDDANPPPADSETGRFFGAAAEMDAALHDIPRHIQQVYVVSAGGLVPANPESIRALFGMRAELFRLVDVTWECRVGQGMIAVDHSVADGVVILDAALPPCASRFFFAFSNASMRSVLDGTARRDGAIAYSRPTGVGLDLGERADGSMLRHLIMHVRPEGPARFIVEHGGPGGGLTWFDTP